MDVGVAGTVRTGSCLIPRVEKEGILGGLNSMPEDDDKAGNAAENYLSQIQDNAPLALVDPQLLGSQATLVNDSQAISIANSQVVDDAQPPKKKRKTSPKSTVPKAPRKRKNLPIPAAIEDPNGILIEPEIDLPKEAMNGVDGDLAEIKKRWGNSLVWGKLFAKTTDDGDILQFAWKDAAVVLFMSTVSDIATEVTRSRKRPSNVANHVTAAWGEEVVKELAVPQLIDDYNHFMNGIDLADQMRVNYHYDRRNYSTWCPLFHWLREMAITNCAIIWKASKASNKLAAHKEYRLALANKLMAMTRSRSFIARQKPTKEVPVEASCTGKLVAIAGITRYCISCQAAKRTAEIRSNRKPLGELSVNSIRGLGGHKSSRSRPPRTRYQCINCNIRICDNSACIAEHLKSIST